MGTCLGEWVYGNFEVLAVKYGVGTHVFMLCLYVMSLCYVFMSRLTLYENFEILTVK